MQSPILVSFLAVLFAVIAAVGWTLWFSAEETNDKWADQFNEAVHQSERLLKENARLQGEVQVLRVETRSYTR